MRLLCSAGCAQGVLGSNGGEAEHKMELAKIMTVATVLQLSILHQLSKGELAEPVFLISAPHVFSCCVG